MSGPLITLFTIPKPFEGHVGLIQRNALATWVRLEPRSDVLLLGDEPGVAQAAAELGVRHLPGVGRNALGTPLVSDAFARAEQVSRSPLLGYVNTDILLLSDFAAAVGRVAELRREFLLVGRRRDLDLREPIQFTPGWEQHLRGLVARDGKLHAVTGIDYFVYRRGLWPEIPPFAVGRTIWDEWLVDQARRRGALLVDGTAAILAVHQNHPYGSPSGKQGVWAGPEARRNLELAGGDRNFLGLPHATHRLRGGRVQSKLLLPSYRRRLEAWSRLYPRRGRLAAVGLRLLDATYRVRRRLGLAHVRASELD